MSRSFHAHIYFNPQTRFTAADLREKLGSHFKSQLRYWGKLIDRPIGPHPTPMFEIDFDNTIFNEVITFLMQNHGELSVLIHPQTGNDLLDHTTHALWLGPQLQLNLNILK